MSETLDIRETSVQDIEQIAELLSKTPCFSGTIGPAVTSPNKKLIWFDVEPKDRVLAIRELLHETGLFRTDLPLTKGFIPHLTISEKQRDPKEVVILLDELNTIYKPREMAFKGLSWMIPNDDFVFIEHSVFKLGP